MNGEPTKKILFISHNASRSGAPFVLLYLMQWLRQNTNYQLDIMLLSTGPIMEEFRKVAGTLYSVEHLNQKRHTLFKRLKRRLGSQDLQDWLMMEISKKVNVQSYDLIYGNTIVSLEWVTFFKNNFQVRVICAIHELHLAMEQFYDREYLKTNLPVVDVIIAGSQAVANDLTGFYQVPPAKIKIAHAFIHTYTTPSPDVHVLASAGIPQNRFIIGGASVGEWRKGVDVIIPLGMYLNKHYPEFNYHIVWVGLNRKESFTQNLLVDINKAGLQNRITVLEGTSQYLDFINKFDVFAMLSREDPFPLVSLEAGYLKKPIVMFRNTGGTAELLETGGGEIVDYLDVEALATTIVSLANDPERREHMGELLKKEVTEKYSSDVACKKVLQILKDSF